MPKSTPQTKRPLRTRGRPNSAELAKLESVILKLALDEFLRHGYGGASLTNIVKSAGISKTTLYSRYASKAELFTAIVQQQIDALAPESVLPSEINTSSLEDGLIAYADHMLKRSLRPEIMGINRLMQSESARFPELGEAASNRTHRGIKRIADYIRKCAVNDNMPCKNPESVAEVFIYMIRGWYINTMMTNNIPGPAARKRWIKQSIHVLLSSREAW